MANDPAGDRPIAGIAGRADPVPRGAIRRLLATASCALLVAIAVIAHASDARAEPAILVAIAAEIAEHGEETHLSVTLDGPIEARAFAIDRPDRIVVDLPRVSFRVPADTRPSGGLVASTRLGLFSAERSRIVLELAAPARIAGLDVSRRPDGAWVMTLALAPTSPESFREAVAADAAALREASAHGLRGALPAPGDTRPTIVIDPGHGGIDPGATTGDGIEEKEIVFAFSMRLRERLEESGRFRVVMTREEDVFVALSERVAIARTAGADLLVSIHADSISSAPQVSGLTVWTNAERASDAASAALAERENRADIAGGVAREEVAGEVADILRELTARETRGYSHVFARTLVDGMQRVVRLNRNPHRQAAFTVLRAHDVPSVLVELGYLSSRQDIELLVSDAWRDEATAAMAEAIERFFAPRLDRAQVLQTGDVRAAVSP